MTTINPKDLAPETRKALGIAPTRAPAFTKDDVRGWSLKVLAVVATLARQERARVLNHAIKVNRV